MLRKSESRQAFEYLHSVICTSTQRYLHSVIYTALSVQRYLHGVIYTALSTRRHFEFGLLPSKAQGGGVQL